jgi:hypothetical protein
MAGIDRSRDADKIPIHATPFLSWTLLSMRKDRFSVLGTSSSCVVLLGRLAIVLVISATLTVWPSSALLQIDCSNSLGHLSCKNCLYSYLQSYTGNGANNAAPGSPTQGYFSTLQPVDLAKDKGIESSNGGGVLDSYSYYNMDYAYYNPNNGDVTKSTVPVLTVGLQLVLQSLDGVDNIGGTMSITAQLEQHWTGRSASYPLPATHTRCGQYEGTQLP